MNHGLNVRIEFNDGTQEICNNVTEIHYQYPTPLSFKSVAFESDIHGTGCTHRVEKIKEFEAKAAGKKEKAF